MYTDSETIVDISPYTAKKTHSDHDKLKTINLKPGEKIVSAALISSGAKTSMDEAVILRFMIVDLNILQANELIGHSLDELDAKTGINKHIDMATGNTKLKF